MSAQCGEQSKHNASGTIWYFGPLSIWLATHRELEKIPWAHVGTRHVSNSKRYPGFD